MTSAARDRILETADRLFYADGIAAVGVDRIVRESGTAKQTLYNHFASKDDLVVAYLEGRSDRGLRRLRSALDEHRGVGVRERLDLVMAPVGVPIDGFRGCPFVNATAEYPDASHPVRRAVATHRRRFAGIVRDLLAEEGLDDDWRVGSVTMLYDGAMVAARDDPDRARSDVAAALDTLVDAT